MRRASCLLVGLLGCSFRITAEGTPAIDGAVDGPADADLDAGPPAPRLCDPQPGLLVCFAFDAPVLTSPLANEGTAGVAAQLTSVTRIARGSGGAAMVDTSSQIRIPPNALTTGIVSAEAWVRIDVAPPTGSRIGIIDADATSSAVSFFYYDGPQLRFEIGQQLFLTHTVTLGTWIYLAEVCAANVLTAYVDGLPIGSQVGCSPGNATTYGLLFGQNNNQTGGDQWMTGAIDGIRMWTTARSPMQICEAAGRTGC